jgi:hypothetical protein
MSAIDPERTLALPKDMDQWSLTTLREKLVKIGVKRSSIKEEQHSKD